MDTVVRKESWEADGNSRKRTRQRAVRFTNRCMLSYKLFFCFYSLTVLATPWWWILSFLSKVSTLLKRNLKKYRTKVLQRWYPCQLNWNELKNCMNMHVQVPLNWATRSALDAPKHHECFEFALLQIPYQGTSDLLKRIGLFTDTCFDMTDVVVARQVDLCRVKSTAMLWHVNKIQLYRSGLTIYKWIWIQIDPDM